MRVGAKCGGFEIWVKVEIAACSYDLLHSWQFQSSAQASGIWEDFSISISIHRKWHYSEAHSNHTDSTEAAWESRVCQPWDIVTSSLLTTLELLWRLKLIKSNLSCLSSEFLVLIKVSFETLETLMSKGCTGGMCWPCGWSLPPSFAGCRHQFWHNWASYHSFIKIDLSKLKSNWNFFSKDKNSVINARRQWMMKLFKTLGSPKGSNYNGQTSLLVSFAFLRSSAT